MFRALIKSMASHADAEIKLRLLFGSSEKNPTRLRSSHPSPRTLANQSPLEFRQGSRDVEEEPAAGSGRINRLRKTSDAYSLPFRGS